MQCHIAIADFFNKDMCVCVHVRLCMCVFVYVHKQPLKELVLSQ